VIITGALVIKIIMIAAKLVPILSSISQEINALIAVHQDKKRILTILNASKLKRAKC
jgi:hypothetical protein